MKVARSSKIFSRLRRAPAALYTVRRKLSEIPPAGPPVGDDTGASPPPLPRPEGRTNPSRRQCRGAASQWQCSFHPAPAPPRGKVWPRGMSRSSRGAMSWQNAPALGGSSPSPPYRRNPPPFSAGRFPHPFARGVLCATRAFFVVQAGLQGGFFMMHKFMMLIETFL